jgi:magnesium transporter
MAEEPQWKQLVTRLNVALEKPDGGSDVDQLRSGLGGRSPEDIALAMEELKPDQAARAFAALDARRAADVLAKVGPERAKELMAQLQPGELVQLLARLSPREAAALASEAPDADANACLTELPDWRASRDAQRRLAYREGSAGRMMTDQFVRLRRRMTVARALATVRRSDPKVDIPDDLYVVEPLAAGDERERLVGVISIRDLVMAERHALVEQVMATNPVTIRADAADDDAAAVLSKYKFMALPVVDREGYLVGVIPTDDLMQVVVARMRHVYAKAIGTDAEAMEKYTPLQAAKLRVPWLLGTMVIELGAGAVIAHFDDVLKRVILLASFMPVISAISGNVGLQAAAITVRALDTGRLNAKGLGAALFKEGATSFLMAVVCGLVLGGVGAIWSQHLPFGVVIGGALTCSMLTAAFMGTVIPMVSKKLGFDPATTAGPFETAFQDIIGFGVFLWLASLLVHWIT